MVDFCLKTSAEEVSSHDGSTVRVITALAPLPHPRFSRFFAQIKQDLGFGIYVPDCDTTACSFSAALTVLWNMNKGFNNDEIIEQIIKLRLQAVATLELYEKIHARIEFYRKYVSLGHRFKVRLAGPFMLIQGGRFAEDARSKAKALGS